jgi:hypothetical protein
MITDSLSGWDKIWLSIKSQGIDMPERIAGICNAKVKAKSVMFNLTNKAL